MKHIIAFAMSVMILMTISSAGQAASLKDLFKKVGGSSRNGEQCQVIRVHDGDTFTCRELDGHRTTQIRLAEIDAPELKQNFGEASGGMLRSYLMGQYVTVVPTGDEDRGRVIAHVLIDDVSINALMVKNGGAWVYTQYQRDASLSRYQSFAQQHGLGLWASANPIAPWSYRRQAESGYSGGQSQSGLFASRGYTKFLGKDGIIHKSIYGK